MKVFLIGYMSSGKSTIGPKLAKELGVPFIDLDIEIEKRESKTISSIFEEEGGSIRFREVESETFDFIIGDQENFVMATGGGTPCFFDGIKKMLDNGVVVYLKMKAGALKQRILQSENKRPVVARIPANRLLEKIEMHLAGRKSVYESAHIIADGFSVSIKNIIKEILAFQKQRNTK